MTDTTLELISQFLSSVQSGWNHRWRLQIRKALQPATEKDAAKENGSEQVAEKDDSDEEEELATMEELKEYAEAKRIKERKKKAKAREKV